MSDAEKDAQVGRLVLEYSEIKGNLNRLDEKLNQARNQAQLLSQVQVISNLGIVDGVPKGRILMNPNADVLFDGLLGSRELAEVIESRKARQTELDGLAGRIRALAPHLL
jgi:hypothetical protein